MAMSQGSGLSTKGGQGSDLSERETVENTPRPRVDLNAPTLEPAPSGSNPPIDVSSSAATPELKNPTHIGRYVVLRCLGQGGMGVVYSAYDPDLDRKVAVKVVREDIHRGEHVRARLLKEAKAMARISNPNVVHVYEVGEDRESQHGQIFIAMEFVAGTDLVDWQSHHPVRNASSLDQCLRLYLQAAAGLEAAHHSGLIHRDFKPDNVLVGDDGRARVMDFGIAKAHEDPLGREISGTAIPVLPQPGERLTQLGAILGTPGYMAPEQVRGEPADARSDQFSFCAALFEGIYGYQPFEGTTIEEYARNVLSGNLRLRPKTTYGFEVPIAIKQALLRGLALDPAARFPSMHELTAELSKGILPDADSDSLRRSKRRFLSVLLASFLVNCLGVLFWLNGSSKTDLRPALLIAGLLLTATAGLVWTLREQIYLQPGYRRLSYFLLATMCYLVAGRTVGLFLKIPANLFLIQEMVGLAALFASEMQQVGRRYGWLVLLCLCSVALQILWPAGRRLHLNITYGLMLFLSVYLHFRRGSIHHRNTPSTMG